MKGDGWVSLKSGPDRKPRWIVGYFSDGTEHREPAWIADPKAPQRRRPAANEAEALKALRIIIRGLDRGEIVTPEKRRLTVGELLDGLLAWMVNQKKEGKTSSHMKPIRAFFGHHRVVAVTSVMVEKYKALRVAAGKAPATVNRELQSLTHAYSWGADQKPALVKDVLKVDFFDERGNVRQGFLSRADFEAIIKKFTDPNIRDFVEWGFWTGMRKGEVGKLTWEMFDKETWTLRLHAKAAKSRKGRVLVLAGPLLVIIKRRLKARRLDCPLIFHRTSKGKPGQPVKDFRRAWAAACKAVGIVPGRKAGITFHDTRRTAVRNLIRAGVDQTVSMKISGHTTDSTFRRYNITTEDDLRSAVEKVAAYVDTLPTKRKVVKGGFR